VVGSITRPIKELKGFKKKFLKKGETKKVEFSIEANNLKFYNNQLEFVNEQGEFELFIAGSSDHKFTHKFYLD
jgi:beta-glucosidase